MSFNPRQFKQSASALESNIALPGEMRPSDEASRLVIRDKSNADTPAQMSAQWKAFPAVDTEEITFRAGFNNTPIIIRHPIPDESAPKSVAHVDWLGFSLCVTEDKIRSWLFNELHTVFGLSVTQIKNTGWNGFKHCAMLGNFGLVAWGGKSQRGKAHVEINGTGCGHVVNWNEIQQWAVEHTASITRIDLAHDDLSGLICNIDQVLQWAELNGFNCGGRNAKVKVVGDWHDQIDGRTVTVGTRGNKFLRCYEKGKQLKDPDSPWFRVELELRNKNRYLPWDMLTRPGQYLAGSYPCLTFLTTEQIKLKTMQKATALTLASMTAHASRLSGKAINVLMEVHQGDSEKVVQVLRRSGIPKRLEPYAEHVYKPLDKERCE